VGHDAALLPVRVEGDAVLVEEEKIGELAGFAFRVDPAARADDVRLLTAAAEKHLPRLLAARAGDLAAAVHAGEAELALEGGAVLWRGRGGAAAQPGAARPMRAGCRNWWPPPRWTGWTTPPAPNCWPRWNNGWPRAGSRWRRWRGWRRPALILPAGRNCALLIRLLEGGHGERAGSGLERLGREQREALRKLGVKVGALDCFTRHAEGQGAGAVAAGGRRRRRGGRSDGAGDRARRQGHPLGYRRLGAQALRLDRAETLLREAHAPGRGAAAGPCSIPPRRCASG
jgi:ATP-dependent RNA helicase SUPV3L1/SUV3